MSNALICDTCTAVFPEGAEGSVSGNGTFTRTIEGVRKELNKRQDQCPACAETQSQHWNGTRTLEAPATERAKREVLEHFRAEQNEDAYAFERGNRRGMQP